ncbi:hypothetical protein AMK59_3570 [Oryctes borbonicus]|uniref:Uncharacterized protein n=1 Tax=Oryctes borbonicus TaxID=1629725 RepID=A0A0T6B4H8_9SCAR|nr:hypothetical protein AMK59_3570 [Oryctes borbonicus]
MRIKHVISTYDCQSSRCYSSKFKMASVWKPFTFLTLFLVCTCCALPISDSELAKNLTSDEANGTAKDLYVIKTIVYEIGILTDASNTTDNETETHEQIDLTFFDPITNGSAFDLSNIPIPIQTNISGISVTGIAPVNLGTIKLPKNDKEAATLNTNFPLKVPLLPNALISVKRNITTSDELREIELLEKFPEIFDINDTVTGTPLEIQTNVVPLAEDESKRQNTPEFTKRED